MSWNIPVFDSDGKIKDARVVGGALLTASGTPLVNEVDATGFANFEFPADYIWDPSVDAFFNAGDTTVEEGGTNYSPNDVQPGEIIEIVAGIHTAKHFGLINLAGAPDNRITIRNDTTANEPVVFEHTGNAFEFFKWVNCEEFIFDGTGKYVGAPAGDVGITIINNVWTENRVSAGIIFRDQAVGTLNPTGYLKLNGSTQKFRIKGFELDGKGNVDFGRSGIGFMAHDRINYQKVDQFDLLFRDDCIIEKYYIHDTHHEAIYLGNNWGKSSSALNADPRDCHIQYGIADDCGWGGGQIKGSWDDTLNGGSSINHCACYRCGGEATGEGDNGHNQGFQITGSNASIHHCLSVDSSAAGIAVRVLQMDVGVGPEYSQAQIDTKQEMNYSIYNCLVIRNGRNSQPALPPEQTKGAPGILINHNSATINSATGELICDCVADIRQVTVIDGDQQNIKAVTTGAIVTTTDCIAAGDGDGNIGVIGQTGGGLMTEINNLKNTLLANNFEDADNDDYHLTSSSPARNNGSASGFPVDDIVEISRPLGSDADQGAYEFVEQTMSYLFDGSGDYLDGTFSSTFTVPISIVCWIRCTSGTWGQTSKNWVAIFSDNFDDNDNSLTLSISVGTADEVTATSRTASDNNASELHADGQYDDEWVMIAGVFTNNSLREIYVEDFANVGDATGTRDVGSIDSFRIGANMTESSGMPGFIAEIAVFNVALTEGQIDALQTATGASAGGPAPNTVNSANCIGYWSLDTDQANHPDQSVGGAGPTLVVTSAIFDSEHPVIAGVSITDVDGDEQWNDGDTGLVITGTGFV